MNDAFMRMAQAICDNQAGGGTQKEHLELIKILTKKISELESRVKKQSETIDFYKTNYRKCKDAYARVTGQKQ